MHKHKEPTAVEPTKDQQSITPDGKRLDPRIDGLLIRRLTPQEDERGELIEMYREDWGLHPAPVTQVYQAMVRPGAIKGWVMHKKQEDRIYICRGVLRWAFFDDRDDSPTSRMLNVFTFSDRTRALIVTPRGVWHAVKNIGQEEAVFINMPTRAYDYADPDKFRLPIKNDLIPFAFDDGPGW